METNLLAPCQEEVSELRQQPGRESAYPPPPRKNIRPEYSYVILAAGYSIIMVLPRNELPKNYFAQLAAAETSDSSMLIC